jgi:hypothetical protein
MEDQNLQNLPVPAASPSELARQLALRGASKGGRARADMLSPQQRSDAARHAVEARWAKRGVTPIPKATHAGELTIGDVRIPCAVLDDGTRVLTQRGFSVALGRHQNPNKKGSVVNLPVFLGANNLKEFIDNDLERSSAEIKFRLPEGSGGMDGNIALGYRATLLQEVCNVYLKAKHAGRLLPSQEHIARRCLILLNGLATVGIIALVDEATGYQADRARDALAKVLEAFIAKEIRRWVKTFPIDFYKEMFRLRGWTFNESNVAKRPGVVGKYTNDIVYRRLAPGVLDALDKANPVTDSGYRKHKHHQHLTENTGHPSLLQLLGSVVTIMKLSDDWDGFMKMLDRLHPRQLKAPLFEEDGKTPALSQ